MKARYDALSEEMAALGRQREAWQAEEAEGRRQLAEERQQLDAAAQVGLHCWAFALMLESLLSGSAHCYYILFMPLLRAAAPTYPPWHGCGALASALMHPSRSNLLSAALLCSPATAGRARGAGGGARPAAFRV